MQKYVPLIKESATGPAPCTRFCRPSPDVCGGRNCDTRWAVASGTE